MLQLLQLQLCALLLLVLYYRGSHRANQTYQVASLKMATVRETLRIQYGCLVVDSENFNGTKNALAIKLKSILLWW
jgi:hypothetical protein